MVVVKGEGRVLLGRHRPAAVHRGGCAGRGAAARSAQRGLRGWIAGCQAGFTWLRDPEIVSIAAVRGHAIGAGFQLALSCDLRVFADDAKVCMKEPALGLVPDLTGTKPLVDIVGLPRALEICLTARTVEARRGPRAGTGRNRGAGRRSRRDRGRPDRGAAGDRRRHRQGDQELLRAVGVSRPPPRPCGSEREAGVVPGPETAGPTGPWAGPPVNVRRRTASTAVSPAGCRCSAVAERLTPPRGSLSADSGTTPNPRRFPRLCMAAGPQRLDDDARVHPRSHDHQAADQAGHHTQDRHLRQAVPVDARCVPARHHAGRGGDGFLPAAAQGDHRRRHPAAATPRSSASRGRRHRGPGARSTRSSASRQRWYLRRGSARA